ncbi:tRNA (adenosine(37)-N6)-threonylcarbamoyltransferase complex dimerization subunit type 1 TsaB [Candidatus Profftia sp. (ex Adelges kitamiensis)]|uniref:tRNA (adenosine(37)-N6)-threonylcarbamoyltransferase complex dimerization subunit type 1 TsaB n=1 Tax=Candidatus Profftia sp. (ex Adelges kitamiensis) TaxID=2864218 RepID=UPI001CE3513E|nr:tRNA (adenosine(37)-N6)-threonylcarbamoyltransferase complex dimerization subunit type 1 TsaB [Candidatus Profftia sp. (ex Adelges kitamiensis)]
MSILILAIDTSTEACSVAIYKDGKTHTLFTICRRSHTQFILPMVQQILAKSRVSLNQLNALTFSCGPGSFTGVRLGMGIAQGLAMGANLPMIGISTLVTMAQGAFRLTGETQVLAAIDARMGEVYWGQYQLQKNGQWLGSSTETVLTPMGVQKNIMNLTGRWATVGTGWVTYPNMAKIVSIKLIDGLISLPHAEDMLPLALIDFALGKVTAVENIQPTYLRNEVTWKKHTKC